VIKSLHHKGLARLFLQNDPSRVRSDLIWRCRIRLSALHRAEHVTALNIPGFDLHALRGKPPRYSLHVNGPWCITFEWRDGHAWRVDLEQYH
jgi:toxin HigB-1